MKRFFLSPRKHQRIQVQQLNTARPEPVEGSVRAGKQTFFLKLILITTITLFFPSALFSIPRLNLFNSYDRLLATKQTACSCWNVGIALEHAFKQHGFQADEDERGNSNCFRKHTDALQLFQNEQDAIAALKGDTYDNAISQLALQFNINDDDGTHGLFIPTGCFKVDNLLLRAQYYLPYDIALGLYLPFVAMQLKNVVWRPSPRNTSTTFEGNLYTTDAFISEIERIAAINLHGWDRSGVGDLTALVSWERYFPQSRQFLKNVFLNARIGFIFPTGKPSDENSFYAPALGNDANFGILGGFNLELQYSKHAHLGVDIELANLWGIHRSKRIKTDMTQTDLLLLHKAEVFEDPGFLQHFTLYAEAFHLFANFSLRAAYQYTKQEESRLYLDSNHFSVPIANSAESQREWTTHNAVFTASYDFFSRADASLKPHFALSCKYGFNGQRAIVFDTITALLSVDF